MSQPEQKEIQRLTNNSNASEGKGEKKELGDILIRVFSVRIKQHFRV